VAQHVMVYEVAVRGHLVVSKNEGDRSHSCHKSGFCLATKNASRTLSTWVAAISRRKADDLPTRAVDKKNSRKILGDPLDIVHVADVRVHEIWISRF